MITRVSCFAFAFLAAAIASAATFETTAPPADGDLYKSAEFRLWVPDKVPVLRGIIIKQHGCGRRGVDHADDLQYQALALKHQCALLGTHFTQNKTCSDWFEPNQGSEKALLQALETLAKESMHPELPKLPWAIWGHSGGALWGHHMAIRYPDRVVAVVARSQGVVANADKASGVPILLNYGEREKTGKFEKVHANSDATFKANRPKGALWSLAIDPMSEHDCRNSRHISIPYFDALLSQRLPKAGETALAPVDTKSAWLGNLETFEVFAEANYPGDKAKAGWLPNEAVARAWSEFCKTGSVADTTPPPAPTRVRAHLNGKLTWEATADLESGIKAFNIYRNGELFGTVAGEGGKAYQSWNYGDEPEPRTPAKMNFAYPDPGGKSRYSISAVNQAGLESKKEVAR